MKIGKPQLNGWIKSIIPSILPMRLPMSPIYRQSRGFTLIEILMVITIMAVIMGISIAAFGSFSSQGKTNQTTLEVGGLLEQARQYAVAQNTFVWVVFNKENEPTLKNDEFTVAIVASKDGTDPNPSPNRAYSYGTVPSATLDLISKIKTFQAVQLKNAGSFTSAQIPSLPPTRHGSAMTGFSENASFQIQIPGTSSPTLFDRSIQFTPNGGIRYNDAPIDFAEFSFQPTQINPEKSDRLAVVVRVNGLTGRTSFYRP